MLKISTLHLIRISFWSCHQHAVYRRPALASRQRKMCTEKKNLPADMTQDSEKHASERLGDDTKDLVSMQTMKSALEREGERGREEGRERKEKREKE